ncbi:MAG: DUF4129 domain-containing protein [Uliginosibacterium sp.]|nr:DUF4129 domain-containing protein [Uliginosibacterium sp.]
MDLERLAVALRPRNSWEALDLGVRFAIQNGRALYASWLAVCLPVALLVFLTIGYGMEEPAWAVMVLWWLKPAFDRIAVHVLSRAVFGESTSISETFASLPRLLFKTGLLRNLSIGRFSFSRSIRLPVDVLEGLNGRAARQRKALIARRISGAANWQTLAWLHLETIFWLGFWVLLLMLVPHELLQDFQFSTLFDGDKVPKWFHWPLYTPLWLASVLLEPLYVAGGFMLYIKRRTDLEAWDVELQFRRLAHAHARSVAETAVRVVCIVCLFGMTMGVSPPAQATAAEAREHACARAPEVLEKVLAQPEFGQDKTDFKLKWRPQAKKQPSSTTPEWLRGWLDALGNGLEVLGNLFALIGRVGGWFLIATVVVLLIALVAKFGWLPAPARRPPPPSALAGFDIRPQSLPEDIPEAARSLLHAGDVRGALSLLFRGALSRLAHQEHVPFLRGDTEGDCLTRVRAHAPEKSAFMARLLGCWQGLAYAHQAIGGSEVETICHEWGLNFGGRTRHD